MHVCIVRIGEGENLGIRQNLGIRKNSKQQHEVHHNLQCCEFILLGI